MESQNNDYRYTPDDLADAVSALLEYLGKDQKNIDLKTAQVRAASAMLHSLADKSGGAVIAGCCTQGCCDDDVLELVSNPNPVQKKQ
jgi:hypothetical protein